MYFKKQNASIKMLFVCVVLFVVTFSLPSGAFGDGHGNGPGVEEIYEQIRNGTPIYEWEESIVTFQNEGMTLVCTLTLPQTNKKCPIIVTLNGFTGNRNDIEVPGTGGERYYARLSRILAEQGIASLRVDFRGSGDSEGTYDMTTFSSQISDTRAALDYIYTQLKHEVKKNSIGVLGYSQGGLVGSVTAARDERVKSLVLWSAVAHAPICYEGLLTKEGIKQGFALPDGGSITLGLYVEDQYICDVTLGKGFFEDLFNIEPLAEIRDYKKPLMAICGSNDVIVWPQPAATEGFLKYHKGSEKLVVLDADHSFDGFFGPEKLDEAIYWSTAWFIKTLKYKH